MKFTELPDTSGVYLFIDSAYEVIYVGKAKSIKKRVISHFGKDKLSAKHIAMISRVRTVDYITTKNEKEALVLENQLIKNIKPRYNILLRDDKTYPYLEVTVSEKFPALKVSRKKDNPDSIYFGPFPNSGDIRAAKKVIDKMFSLRKCRKYRDNKKPCLNYQINKCLSPCTGKIKKTAYTEIVDEILMFLSGSHKKLLKKLEKKMNIFKQEQKYEEAAVIRDQIEDLKGFFPMVNCRRITRKKLEALNRIDPLLILKDVLNMKYKPQVIEGYDISHTSSREAVGSMVYFSGGKPDKKNYRKYKIKQAETADDLNMLREVTYRRLKRLTREDSKLPDIMLIDGGRGQEKAVREMVNKFGIKTIKVLALAKEKGNIYYRGRKMDIDNSSEVFKLLKRVDDEAHRFANAYHRQKRTKSSLD
ncbi:GIY-YIG nuclease family protein [Elusimicrobiota bacterium]